MLIYLKTNSKIWIAVSSTGPRSLGGGGGAGPLRRHQEHLGRRISNKESFSAKFLRWNRFRASHLLKKRSFVLKHVENFLRDNMHNHRAARVQGYDILPRVLIMK